MVEIARCRIWDYRAAEALGPLRRAMPAMRRSGSLRALSSLTVLAAVAYQHVVRPAEALAALDEMERLAEVANNRHRLCEHAILRSETLLAVGDVRGAMTYADDAIRFGTNPAHPELHLAHAQRGAVLAAQGRYRAAANALTPVARPRRVEPPTKGPTLPSFAIVGRKLPNAGQ